MSLFIDALLNTFTEQLKVADIMLATCNAKGTALSLWLLQSTITENYQETMFFKNS